MDKTIPEIYLDSSTILGLVDDPGDKTKDYSDTLWKRFEEKPNEFKIIISRIITEEKTKP